MMKRKEGEGVRHILTQEHKAKGISAHHRREGVSKNVSICMTSIINGLISNPSLMSEFSSKKAAFEAW